MVAIATEVATGNYDLVVLQEVWSYYDFEMIARKTSPVLPYSHYFRSGVIGSGLCILSKGKIVDSLFQVWPLNGYVHKIQHGDWFGGKGVGMCRIHYLGLQINLYTAHLHAVYNHKRDEYLSHRVCQAFEFSQFVTATSHNSDLTIVAGDFNAEPLDVPYRLLCHNSTLRDAFGECEKKEDEIGATNETSRNTYTPKSVLKLSPLGRRIDYVLFGHKEGTEVKTLLCSLPLDKVPGRDFSYSDHEAVVALLNITKSQTAKTLEPNVLERIRVLEDAIHVVEKDLQRLIWDRYLYFFVFALLFCLLFGTVHVQVAYGLQGLLGILRIFFSIVMIFCMLMGTIWNRMENNALLSVLESATILVNYLREEKSCPSSLISSFGDGFLQNTEGPFE